MRHALVISIALLAGCATTPAARPTVVVPAVAPPPPRPAYAASEADHAAWDRARTVLDVGARPRSGAGSFGGGGGPDPWGLPLTAGGGRNPMDVADLRIRDGATGDPCGRAFVGRQPDLHVELTEAHPRLRLYVLSEAHADLTLLVRQPGGAWRCNDDHGRDGWAEPRSPALEFADAPAGRYDVWVGTYDATVRLPATMYVTAGDAHP